LLCRIIGAVPSSKDEREREYAKKQAERQRDMPDRN
jgi:hypothetical protein